MTLINSEVETIVQSIIRVKPYTGIFITADNQIYVFVQRGEFARAVAIPGERIKFVDTDFCVDLDPRSYETPQDFTDEILLHNIAAAEELRVDQIVEYVKTPVFPKIINMVKTEKFVSLREALSSFNKYVDFIELPDAMKRIGGEDGRSGHELFASHLLIFKTHSRFIFTENIQKGLDRIRKKDMSIFSAEANKIDAIITSELARFKSMINMMVRVPRYYDMLIQKDPSRNFLQEIQHETDTLGSLMTLPDKLKYLEFLNKLKA